MKLTLSIGNAIAIGLLTLSCCVPAYSQPAGPRIPNELVLTTANAQFPQATVATTIGRNVITLTNPGAITFPRFNADNTATALSAADLRTALSLGTAALQNTGTSGANIPFLNGTNTWANPQTFTAAQIGLRARLRVAAGVVV